MKKSDRKNVEIMEGMESFRDGRTMEVMEGLEGMESSRDGRTMETVEGMERMEREDGKSRATVTGTP